jgi:hypothetical protein
VTRVQPKFILTSLLALAPGAVGAQTLILSGTTLTTDAADSVHEGATHRNTQVALQTFTTASQLYEVSRVADQIFVRRDGVAQNRAHVWYATESAAGPRLGAYVSDFSSALLANDLTRGVHNLFANSPANGATANIERVDLVVSAGFTATAGLAIPVFDFGAPTSHESFKIALITGIDGAGNPTAYGPLAGIAAGWGQNNVYTHSTFSIQRYQNGQDTTSQYAVLNSTNQGAGGVAFTLADLGVAPGTTIYGYSLFGYDVTSGGNSANLIDWTNDVYFPSTTAEGEGQAGGFDFASVNGILFTAVPEPTVIGWAALGVLAGAGALRRKRR